MEQAEITMIANLHKNTGKTLDEWIEIVQQKNFVKHGEIMKYLKDDYAFTHGFANLVALKAKKSDANSIEDPTLLINKQFKGKEHFIPIYDELIEQILKLGKDIEVLPKNNYVSLKRKKQFATLQAATKTRFEICLTIKGQEAEGVLESITTPNAMCTHRINIGSANEISEEVLNWITVAYNKAG